VIEICIGTNFYPDKLFRLIERKNLIRPFLFFGGVPWGGAHRLNGSSHCWHTGKGIESFSISCYFKFPLRPWHADMSTLTPRLFQNLR